MRRTTQALAVALAAACGPGNIGEKLPLPADLAAKAPPGRLATVQRALRPIAGQYIVVLSSGTDRASGMSVDHAAESIAQAYSAAVSTKWQHALKGFVATMTPEQAEHLAQDPGVELVEEDGIAYGDTTQTGAPWGLDRIDQQALPLDSNYTYQGNGDGVTVYIIDSGLRTTHTDFGGRASGGFSAVSDGYGTNDCNGHGTHVAGTIGGSTYGVAKGAKLVAVRVLGCDNSGPWSDIISGIDWVARNHATPAVANLSLGGDTSSALDTAVKNAVAAGVTFVVAAGNSSDDACFVSPARVPQVITVGATEKTDRGASYTNFGTCLDLFGPGTNVRSAYNTSDSATYTMSGTSMATPHVTGTAALFLSANPNATPADVSRALVDNASAGKLTNIGASSPNKMLYMGFISGGTPPPGNDTTPPTVTLTAPAPGATLTGTTTLSANASDNVAVGKVEFLVDGAVVGKSIAAPYQVNWNSANVSNGSHSFSARAADTSGNSTTSAAVAATVNNAAGSCSNTTQLLVNPGFETGTARPWIATPNVLESNLTPPPHSGRWKAGLDGYGRTHVDDLYQQVTIPAAACTATFSHWLMILTAEWEPEVYDSMTVTVRDTAGTVLGTLATYTNLTPFNAWTMKTFDLSAYRGQTVRLQFHGVEDHSLHTSFYIDDTKLEVIQ